MIIMMYNEYNDVIIFINCNYILHNKCNMLIFKLFFKIMQDYAKNTAIVAIHAGQKATVFGLKLEQGAQLLK